MALPSFLKALRRSYHNVWKKSASAPSNSTGKHCSLASAASNTNHFSAADHESPSISRRLPLAENTSQESVSSNACQDDAQAGTDPSKPITTSSPALDTENLPSRSTTGSASLNHDSEKRKSIGSGPPEPFPSFHREPGPISEPSHAHAVEHRPSNTSARKNYYEQDKDRDRVIPKEILCYLKVMFDGKKLSKRKPFEKFDWQHDASYGMVNSAAEKCLKASPETINKKVWRTDGVCKLFKKDQECSSKALETEDQWAEVLDLIIADFVTTPGNEYAKFHLEITWTYAAVDDKVAEEKYSKKIADLIDERVKTNWRKKKFIPQRDLHALMSQSVIEHLIDKDESLQRMADSSLANAPTFDKKKFIQDVASSHKQLLALCIYEDLPLMCLWQMLYLNKHPAKLPLKDSDIPAATEKRKFDNLVIKQRYFIAYQFPKPTDAKVHCIHLEDDETLPIEACEEVEPIGRGVSKVVYKVQIQPGHHRFTADRTSVFALKEFKNGCPFEDFERESKVLRKLLDVPHKHITPHYASWSQAGHFFMLSPLASCNLKVYWNNHGPRLDDVNFVLWQLRQLRGLADALRHIYNLGGWHHDLKGENILVFYDGHDWPTLKIADFGSAKIHPRRSGARDESCPTTNYSQGTSAYEAPDYVIRGETSRPYDVWTLGCIFMDMLVWTFRLHSFELNSFSNERRKLKRGKLGKDTMFWYVDFDGKCYKTHWKPAVRKRLQGLENICHSDKGRAVFTELVLTTRKMLRMDPEARPKPHEVYNDMDRMTLWAEEAVKEPDWNIKNLLIGSLPSTAKSETSGESNGDGVPVIAPLGHLMMNGTEVPEVPLPSVQRPSRRILGDSTALNFVGFNENLELQGNGSSTFAFSVNDADEISGSNPTSPERTGRRLLLPTSAVSPDRDGFGEAQTVVPSAAASEYHAPTQQVSIHLNEETINLLRNLESLNAGLVVHNNVEGS